MSLIRKCPSCKKYTMKDICVCNTKTEEVSYRFPKIRDAPPSN